MVIGTGTYIPRATFACPRSYWFGVALRFNANALITWTDNVAFFQDGNNLNVTGQITFNPKFWDWSSNRWTLNFMLIESWIKTSPAANPAPLNFQLAFIINPANRLPYIRYAPNGAGTILYPHDLPAAPGNYWRPAFP